MQSFSSPLNDQDFDITRNLLQDGLLRRNAEDRLFNKYSYFIREGSQKYSLTQEESFDAYADAVLSCINTITKGDFSNRSTLKTYLFKIFQNKCVDLIRKKTTNKRSVYRTEDLDEMMVQLSDNSKPAIQQLIDRSDHQALMDAVAALGERCREILNLFAEGFTDKEIAGIANYKTSEVVKTSRMRCLAKLRESFKIV